jgi:3,4-dihydroxy 2-butanone 4-phosphate synthase/GTP cyclohydrolase II
MNSACHGSASEPRVEGKLRNSRFDALAGAVGRLSEGLPAIIVDDSPGGSNGAVLSIAARLASAQTVAFLVRHTSGFICVAVPPEYCDRLGLPPMAGVGWYPRTPFTVTVDAREGVGTGISAADRAHTIGLLGRPDTPASALCRPGHVVPVRLDLTARPDVHTALAHAAMRLSSLSGTGPATAYAAMVSAVNPIGLAERDELRGFGASHNVPLVRTSEVP